MTMLWARKESGKDKSQEQLQNAVGPLLRSGMTGIWGEVQKNLQWQELRQFLRPG
jgi:hypothetical protein